MTHTTKCPERDRERQTGSFAFLSEIPLYDSRFKEDVLECIGALGCYISGSCSEILAIMTVAVVSLLPIVRVLDHLLGRLSSSLGISLSFIYTTSIKGNV